MESIQQKQLIREKENKFREGYIKSRRQSAVDREVASGKITKAEGMELSANYRRHAVAGSIMEVRENHIGKRNTHRKLKKKKIYKVKYTYQN